MRKLLKVEALKLKKSMAFKVMMIIIIVMNLFSACVYLALDIIMQKADMSENAAGEILSRINGLSVFNDSMGMSGDVMMLVLIFLCISISDDFLNRTLQNEISAGYSRSSIAISRFISGFVIYVIYSLLYTSTTFLFTTLMFGFGEKVTAAVAADMLLRYLLSVIGNAGMLSIFIFIIFMVKKMGISLGICLAFLIIGLPVLNILFVNVGSLNNIYEWLPFGTMGSLINRLDTADIAFEAAKITGVAAVTSAVMLFINIKTFKRAELK